MLFDCSGIWRHESCCDAGRKDGSPPRVV